MSYISTFLGKNLVAASVYLESVKKIIWSDKIKRNPKLQSNPIIL